MLPLWAKWNSRVKQRYTIGVEEELMLLGGASAHEPSPSSDAVLSRLSGELFACVSPETHASVIELVTGIHRCVTQAMAELAALRSQLARELSELGLHAACAGTYPLVRRDDIRTSGAGRYGTISASVLAENRFLAARDGLHARLINPTTRQLEPVRELVYDLVERCRPFANALGCSAELEQIGWLAAANGADLQRAWAREEGLLGLVATLSRRFTAPEPNDRGREDGRARIPADDQQPGLEAVRIAN
jgi:gamma-glutamyl:cysteine ligase YbdK (ATP-grasp superfamily)